MPDGYVDGNLFGGVSCAAVGECMAVGDGWGASGDGIEPAVSLLAETLSGGVWTGTKPPLPAPGEGNLEGVSCPSVGTCIAVGDYIDYSGGDTIEYPLIETYRNGTWTAIKLTLTPSSSSTSLSGVSCPTTDWFVAVGSAFDQNAHPQPLVITLANGSWTISKPSYPAGEFGGDLYDVSCAWVGNCVAVGSGFVETLAGGTWAATTPAALTEVAPTAISCPAVGACVGLGAQWVWDGDNNSQFKIVAATLADGTWQTTNLPVPGGASQTYGYVSLSCSSTTDCAASLSAEYPGNNEDDSTYAPLIETLANGAWVATPLPMSADAASSWGEDVNGVSCAPGGYCAAIGDNGDAWAFQPE